VDAFIEGLVRIVTPPKRPVHAGTLKAFQAVERSLGMRLPDGYKRVVRTYGQGVWQKFWCVASPFAEDQSDHQRPWYMPRYVVTAGPEHCAVLRRVEAEYPGTFPWPIYPEPGGLFPWALTDDGGTLYWLTAGHPESWPTIYDPHDLRPEKWERFDLSFSELLYKTVVGESGLFHESLGESFEYGRPDAFRPWHWSPDVRGTDGETSAESNPS
jgi:hypothetical protein